MLRRLAHWLQLVILFVALLLIGIYLANQWPTLRAYPWRIHGGWLSLAVLFTLGAWAGEIELWRRLLHRLHHVRLPFFTTVRIWFLSAIVRYVPGNIWQPLSLTLYNGRYGIPVEATITSVVLFQVIVILATAPIAVLFVLWDRNQSLFSQTITQTFGQAVPWLALLALAPAIVLMWRPDWLSALLNWTLAKLGRPTLTTQLDRGSLFGLTLFGVLVWVVWGAAFASFTFGVAGSGVQRDVEMAGYLIASYPIAYTIGFLSLITPSGFGVREGAFLLLLVPRIDAAVVTVLALANRAWTTTGELIMALISAPLERRGRSQADAVVESNLPTSQAG